MAAPQTTTQFANAVDPGYRKHWSDAFAEKEPKMEMVLRVKDQEDQVELHSSYTGLGALSAVSEGETIPEDAPVQGYTATYTDQKYTKLYSVTKETRMWTKTQDIVNAAKMGGRATAREVERVGANIFLRGFNTSYTALSTNVPLFSTVIPREDGGATRSNASSTGIPLSEANVETGQLAGEEFLDGRGQLKEHYLDTLLTPSALRKEALIIVRSDLRSATANNDINVNNKSMVKYEGVGADVLCWVYLGAANGGSDTAWFMLDSAEDTGHKITLLFGERPKVGEMNINVGYKNDIIYWKYGFHASTGWDDHGGAWGSKGDGAAYSS